MASFTTSRILSGRSPLVLKEISVFGLASCIALIISLISFLSTASPPVKSTVFKPLNISSSSIFFNSSAVRTFVLGLNFQILQCLQRELHASVTSKTIYFIGGGTILFFFERGNRVIRHNFSENTKNL